MSIVPNVSSVFRDLSHISASSEFLGRSQQQPSYSLEPQPVQETTSLEGLYSYKQKRHE